MGKDDMWKQAGTEEMGGKCLNTKGRRQLGTGNWRYFTGEK